MTSFVIIGNYDMDHRNFLLLVLSHMLKTIKGNSSFVYNLFLGNLALKSLEIFQSLTTPT